MAVKVAINGFGRIGRLVFRAGFDNKSMEIVAINDLTDAKTLAHLLKYDSVHRTWGKKVESDDKNLIVDGKKVAVFAEKDPTALPWKALGVDIVVESTGKFSTSEKAGTHIKAGARVVIISAPAKGADIPTVVMGVNENSLQVKPGLIVSNASCTTNCLAPIVKVLVENFGFKKGLMTTIHSYTNDQRILDLQHSDLRRARAAALSMIPTTTGAAKATGLVIPQVKGKINGLSIRVPTPNVSLVDLVCEVEKTVTVADVNNAVKAAAESSMGRYIEYCAEPLVSMDFCGNSHSAIFDSLSTDVIVDNMVKVLAWYDNEWGYSSRVVDLINHIGGRL